MESASSDCSENVLMSEARESPLIALESKCGVELSMLDVLSTLGERDSLNEGLIVSILLKCWTRQGEDELCDVTNLRIDDVRCDERKVIIDIEKENA